MAPNFKVSTRHKKLQCLLLWTKRVSLMGLKSLETLKNFDIETSIATHKGIYVHITNYSLFYIYIYSLFLLHISLSFHTNPILLPYLIILRECNLLPVCIRLRCSRKINFFGQGNIKPANKSIKFGSLVNWKENGWLPKLSSGLPLSCKPKSLMVPWFEINLS